jgi:hypothetical protein
MSKRIKLMLVSIVLAVFLASASIVIPDWAVSMMDISPPAATEIAGFRGGVSPS